MPKLLQTCPLRRATDGDIHNQWFPATDLASLSYQAMMFQYMKNNLGIPKLSNHAYVILSDMDCIANYKPPLTESWDFERTLLGACLKSSLAACPPCLQSIEICDWHWVDWALGWRCFSVKVICRLQGERETRTVKSIARSRTLCTVKFCAVARSTLIFMSPYISAHHRDRKTSQLDGIPEHNKIIFFHICDPATYIWEQPRINAYVSLG